MRDVKVCVTLACAPACSSEVDDSSGLTERKKEEAQSLEGRGAGIYSCISLTPLGNEVGFWSRTSTPLAGDRTCTTWNGDQNWFTGLIKSWREVKGVLLLVDQELEDMV